MLSADGEAVQTSSVAVTACLIVRDEADSLAACLESVRPFVAEIVVVDTGSTDGTRELARGLGATVVRVPWRDDFAAARNAALTSCTQPWVLSIDADERAEGLAAWLPEMLAVLDDGVLALNLQVTQQGEFDMRVDHVHRATKLFRRDRCHWIGRVHELVADATGLQVPAPELPAEVLRLVHHGYADHEVAAWKAERNTRIAELQLAELIAADAPDATLAHAALDLGRSQLRCGRRAHGRNSLLFARDRSAPGDQIWSWANEFLRWDVLGATARGGAVSTVREEESRRSRG